MRYRTKLLALGAILIAVFGLSTYYLVTHNHGILSPAGQVASKERRLIILSTVLMLIVVIPVYVMTFGIAWKYRETNTKAKYTPDWDHDTRLESLWWGIPFAIIIVLAVVTFKSSHELDPFKPLSSSQPVLTIQVIALQWKWLFIYPDQKIASVNYFRIPQGRPVKFEITSDAPMNSFWIPQLGGQIYAMPGMSTELNLEADKAGSYRGLSANISGTGFAGMDFTAQATSQTDYWQWVSQVSANPGNLSIASYSQLARPSQNNPVAYFGAVSNDVYANAIDKYTLPPNFQVVPATYQGVE